MKNQKIKIAINGFGRIGRAIAKINEESKFFDLVLINDINPNIENLVYLFKYDSTYGKYPGEVVFHDENHIRINKSVIRCESKQALIDVPWDLYDVDIIIDSSGIEANIDQAKTLTKTGKVQKVIITHSTDKSDIEIIMGVNDDKLDNSHKVISNSICDANAIAHIIRWFDNDYGIENGALTTLHPWLSYQNLVDGPSISQSNPGVIWNDFALGRASSDSLIPKNTTAMKAVEKLFPNLENKIISLSYRVPTDIVASSDITLNLRNHISLEDLESYILKKVEDNKYVRINSESLISLDYEKDQSSAVIDMQWIKVVDKTIKIVIWYDNEWGYSSRVIDLARKIL